MTDAALVERAQAGDELAFRRLVDRHRGLLIRIVNPYFMRGAEWGDLFQEALFGFHKAVQSYKVESGVTFLHFALMCARRQVITAVKTANRGKHRALNDAVSLSQPQIGASEDEDVTLEGVLPILGGDPVEVLERREEVGAVVEAAGGLTDLERASVLGIADGLSYEEIRAHTGGNHKQVDNAAQRGRRKMARMLEAA